MGNFAGCDPYNLFTRRAAPSTTTSDTGAPERCYDRHLCLHFQRQSNNYSPRFTHQQVITVYLFGLLQRRFTHQDTYELIKDYWLSWLAHLPSYQGYNYRINQLHWHLEVIAGDLMAHPPEL